MFSQYLHFNYNTQATLEFDRAIFHKVDIIFHFVKAAGRMDTLFPFYCTDYSIFFQSPGKIIPSTYFLSVFQWKFWAATILLILLFLIFIKMYSNVYGQSFGKYIEMIFQKFGISSENIDDVSLAMKFTLLTLGLFTICFTASFSGLLVSKFSTENEILPFETLDELLNQNVYYICSVEQSIPKLFLLPFESTNKMLSHPDCKKIKSGKTTIQLASILQNSICNNSKLTYFEEVSRMTSAIKKSLTHNLELLKKIIFC